MRRKLLVICSAIFLLMLGMSASTMIGPVSGDNGLVSDWPMLGHDPARTGHTNTTGPVMCGKHVGEKSSVTS